MAAEQLYLAGNYTRPTTAAPVKQPTGTAARTMLQLASGAASGMYIVEWGISFDASAAGVPIEVELFGTTAACTAMTALAATDVSLLTDPAATTDVSNLQYGTALSGYNTAGGAAEVSPANYRMLDIQQIGPTNQWSKLWPLGREPRILASQFVRVRVTAGASVNAYCYVVWGE